MTLTGYIIFTWFFSIFAMGLVLFVKSQERIPDNLKRIQRNKNYYWYVSLCFVTTIAITVVLIFGSFSRLSDLPLILSFSPPFIPLVIWLFINFKGPGMIVNRKMNKKIFLNKLLLFFNSFYPIVYMPLVIKCEEGKDKDFQSSIFRALYFKISFDMETINYFYRKRVACTMYNQGEKIDYRSYLEVDFKRIFSESIGMNMEILINNHTKNQEIENILLEIREKFQSSFLLRDCNSLGITEIKLKRKTFKFNNKVSYKILTKGI